MSRNVEPVGVELEIRGHTGERLLVSAPRGPEHWLPRSRIRLEGDSGTGRTVVAAIPRWLAEDAGLA